ncbi:16317_t:CDS:1, partial [Racocetra persica]
NNDVAVLSSSRICIDQLSISAHRREYALIECELLKKQAGQ